MENKKNDAIAPTAPQALAARPDFLTKDDRRGLETMGRDDISLPRLGLAQALSPEVTDGDPKRIEGLQPGDLFNSMTKQSYGKTITVQVLLKCDLRAMLFKPIEQGGGMLDPDLPLDAPEMQWGPNGEKPAGTLFRDYIALVHPTGELIALSFKGSGIRVAKHLNSLITMRNAPIFAGLYTITTDQELKPKPHKVYKVQNAGWVTKEQYEHGGEQHEAMKGLNIKIDREHGREDPTDPNAPDADKDPVPF